MKRKHSALSSLLRQAVVAHRHAVGSAVILGCLVAPAARAGEAKPSESLWGEKTEITLGAGVGVMPRYLGSSETRLVPIPAVALQRGAFFADIVRGIGIEYQMDSGFYASTSLGYDMGRTNRNSTWQPGSKRLKGMGEIDGSTTFNVLIAQPLAPWLSVNAEAEFRVAGQRDRGKTSTDWDCTRT